MGSNFNNVQDFICIPLMSFIHIIAMRSGLHKSFKREMLRNMVYQQIYNGQNIYLYNMFLGHLISNTDLKKVQLIINITV